MLKVPPKVVAFKIVATVTVAPLSVIILSVRVEWDESITRFKVSGDFQVTGDIGFYGTGAQAKGSILGTRDGVTALTNLLIDLDGKGLIADATSP